MGQVAWCNYIRMYDPAGVYVEGTRYQNYFINSTSEYGGNNYAFLQFAVTSGLGTGLADRAESTLACAVNEISASLITQAVQEGWRLQVQTVILNALTNAEIGLFTDETWMCDSYSQDLQVITLKMASPFDAIDANVPPRVLTEELVGSIPPPGSISLN